MSNTKLVLRTEVTPVGERVRAVYTSVCPSSSQATFEKLENELREVNANAETLKKNSLELTELKHVLAITQLFFDEVSPPPHSGITGVQAVRLALVQTLRRLLEDFRVW